MQYHSTRNKENTADSLEAVLAGLAPDGGLYVPQVMPRVDVKKVLEMSAMDMAKTIIGAFLPDMENMDTLVEQAYRDRFETDALTPSVAVGDFTVLELFRGPTSAFKDVALCMLPRLLTAAKKQKEVQEDIMILTATSGDTGKAALEGFHDVEGVKICVFYPDGGVSQVQRAQMVTQEGGNVAVCAVRGNFDDAQTGVKNLFAATVDGRLPGSYRLSTANSINIGRLAPQVTYYFKAYADLIHSGKIQFGDYVNFCVPTGNFGDILAGWLAKQLGLPVGRLICASNANNVLTDFMESGTYDRRRPLHKTSSPSMDILVSSNLERLLYFLSGDTELVADLMKDLNTKGFYTVPKPLLQQIQSQFGWGCCGDREAAETIGKVFRDKGYLCDPHTATAWYVAEDYVNRTGDKTPMVVLSTASAYKFPAAVLAALGQIPVEDGFDQMEQLSQLTGTKIPANLATLRGKQEKHTAVIEKHEMLNFVKMQ